MTTPEHLKQRALGKVRRKAKRALQAHKRKGKDMPKYLYVTHKERRYRIFRRWSKAKPGYLWITEAFNLFYGSKRSGLWQSYSERDTKSHAIASIYEGDAA